MIHAIAIAVPKHRRAAFEPQSVPCAAGGFEQGNAGAARTLRKLGFSRLVCIIRNVTRASRRYEVALPGSRKARFIEKGTQFASAGGPRKQFEVGLCKLVRVPFDAEKYPL